MMLYINCKKCDKKVRRKQAVKKFAPDWNGGRRWAWYLCGEHHKIKDPMEAIYGDIKLFEPIMNEIPTGMVIGKSYLSPVFLELRVDG